MRAITGMIQPLRPGAMGGLARKVILGYMLIVLLPICLLGPFVYTTLRNGMVEEYSRGKQQLIEQAYSNLKVTLAQIESLYGVIQYNTNLLEFLDGDYVEELEQTYSYLRYIAPMFEYMKASNPSIDTVTIYKTSESTMNFDDELLPLSRLPEGGRWMTRLKSEGEWELPLQAADGALQNPAYYQKIYNPEYTRALGLLVIRLKPQALLPFYDNLKMDNPNARLLLADGDRIFYRSGSGNDGREFGETELIKAEAEDGAFVRSEGGRIANGLYIHEFGIWAIVEGSIRDEFPELRPKMNVVFAVTIVLLVLLSVIYYYFTVRVANRILRLAKHMRKINENNLTAFHGETGRDEIGFLTVSFNGMMRRIDELVNEVQLAEILRKEAAYQALHAQIKPHFLYNTLESLRMLAESMKARAVADMCFAFGRLIRYSMSIEAGDTMLGNELKHAEYYLQIYRLRLGEARLQYRLDVGEDAAALACPRFILQPLLENSISHGFAGLERPAFIRISAEREEGAVRIVVSDDGRGMSEERLQQVRSALKEESRSSGAGPGIGLTNVARRLRLYNGGKDGLELRSSPDGGVECELYIVQPEEGMT